MAAPFRGCLCYSTNNESETALVRGLMVHVRGELLQLGAHFGEFLTGLTEVVACLGKFAPQEVDHVFAEDVGRCAGGVDGKRKDGVGGPPTEVCSQALPAIL